MGETKLMDGAVSSRRMSLENVEERIDHFDKLNRLRALTDAESNELCRLFDRRRDHLAHIARKDVIRSGSCANGQ